METIEPIEVLQTAKMFFETSQENSKNDKSEGDALLGSAVLRLLRQRGVAHTAPEKPKYVSNDVLADFCKFLVAKTCEDVCVEEFFANLNNHSIGDWFEAALWRQYERDGKDDSLCDRHVRVLMAFADDQERHQLSKKTNQNHTVTEHEEDHSVPTPVIYGNRKHVIQEPKRCNWLRRSGTMETTYLWPCCGQEAVLENGVFVSDDLCVGPQKCHKGELIVDLRTTKTKALKAVPCARFECCGVVPMEMGSATLKGFSTKATECGAN